jgi:hypothetical protein
MPNKFRQFIVCGASTGGKLTFAHELVKRYHVEHIQIDPIIEAFETVFPEHGITHNANTHEKHLDVCQKFKPFLFKMIDGLDVFNFVIEGFRMPLADLHAKYGSTHGFFVFGYPTISAREKVVLCRRYDKNNWTNDIQDDQELEGIFEFLVAESRHLQTECIRLNIPFFDTGEDYQGQIDNALALADAPPPCPPPEGGGVSRPTSYAKERCLTTKE